MMRLHDVPPSHSLGFAPYHSQVLDEGTVRAGLDKAESELGGTVNLVVNCAGVAVAQRVLSKKGVHSLESYLKVR